MNVFTKLRRVALAATSAAVIVIGPLVVAGPAAAAPAADALKYQGINLNSAKLPAGVVLIEFQSSTPARSVEFYLDNSSVGIDTDLEPRGENWYAAATVDLAGRQGTARLKVNVQGPRGFRTFWKYFTVVPAAEESPTRLSGLPAAGPASTGVPRGLGLVPSGPLRITKAGAVVEGLDVRGSIVIDAPGVTIRNTRITADSSAVKRVIEGTSKADGTVIDRVEIDGAGRADIGVDVSRARLSRINVHGVNDGVRLGSNIELRDSWVHDLVRKGELHPDAVQGISAQNIVIEGNVLDPRSADRKDLGNAALMLGSETGTKVSRNVIVRDNFLQGGNFTVNVRGDINAEAISITGNLFGMASRYGAVVAPPSVVIGSDNLIGPARARVVAHPA